MTYYITWAVVSACALAFWIWIHDKLEGKGAGKYINGKSIGVIAAAFLAWVLISIVNNSVYLAAYFAMVEPVVAGMIFIPVILFASFIFALSGSKQEAKQ